MGRGTLTEAIKVVAKKQHGIDLTTEGLRLMPYIQFRLINHGNLDPNHLTQQDRKILSEWRTRGLLEGGISEGSLECTKAFWDTMSELIWLAYVPQNREVTQ